MPAKPAKSAKKKAKTPPRKVHQVVEAVVTPTPPVPADPRVRELELALESVNRALITRNTELEAAQAAASREIFKDVVVLTALLDAKAYLNARGGIEAALIVHSISQVESRLGAEAVAMASVIQRLKALAAEQRRGGDVAVEDVEDLLIRAQRLL